MAEGNTMFGGYTSFADMFDGGGAGYSGDQFMHGGGAGMDSNGDMRISADEYSANPGMAQHNFFSNFSNDIGATPSGSGLAPSGVGAFVNNGGIIGQLLNPGGTGEVYAKGEYVDGVWTPYQDARGHPGIISEVMKLVYGQPAVQGNSQPAAVKAGSVLATQGPGPKPAPMAQNKMPYDGSLYGNIPSRGLQTADDGYVSMDPSIAGIHRNDGTIDYTQDPQFHNFARMRREADMKYNKPTLSLRELNYLYGARIGN
jgi:hypothetical protein